MKSLNRIHIVVILYLCGIYIIFDWVLKRETWTSNEEGIFLTGTDVNSSSWATLAMCWIRSYLICMFISVSLISFSYQYKCNFIIIICTLNKHEFIGVLNSLECSSCIFFLGKKSIFLKVLIFWSIKILYAMKISNIGNRVSKGIFPKKVKCWVILWIFHTPRTNLSLVDISKYPYSML